jgi:hypothetical protein
MTIVQNHVSFSGGRKKDKWWLYSPLVAWATSPGYLACSAGGVCINSNLDDRPLAAPISGLWPFYNTSLGKEMCSLYLFGHGWLCSEILEFSLTNSLNTRWLNPSALHHFCYFSFFINLSDGRGCRTQSRRSSIMSSIWVMNWAETLKRRQMVSKGKMYRRILDKGEEMDKGVYSACV